MKLGQSRNTKDDTQTWVKHVTMNATLSDSTSIGAGRFSIKFFDHRKGSPIGRLRWVILDEVRKQSSIVHNAKGKLTKSFYAYKNKEKMNFLGF